MRATQDGELSDFPDLDDLVDYLYALEFEASARDLRRWFRNLDPSDVRWANVLHAAARRGLRSFIPLMTPYIADAGLEVPVRSTAADAYAALLLPRDLKRPDVVAAVQALWDSGEPRLRYYALPGAKNLGYPDTIGWARSVLDSNGSTDDERFMASWVLDELRDSGRGM